ncbi:MAG: RodZ domain-containing protein [Syntrophorhabdus sp.]
MSLDLQTVGKSLKDRREEKELTISDVSEALCLRKTLVQAIEEGNWNMLPHEVYVRGYLKEYLHLLDMAQDILATQEIPEEKPVVSTEPVNISKISQKRHIPRRAIVVPLIFVLIISFFVLNQIYKNRSAARSTANQISQSDGVTTQHASVDVGQPAASAQQVSGEQSQQAGLSMSDKKLMITCNERTWISVVIDANEKKEFMLNPQEMIVINAKDNFDLLIGNAAGVKLNLNGKEIALAGKSGEVKRIKVS